MRKTLTLYKLLVLSNRQIEYDSKGSFRKYVMNLNFLILGIRYIYLLQ